MIDEVTVTISLSAARLKSDPNTLAFRLEFRGTQPCSDDMEAQLMAINKVLNGAFVRFVPDFEKRFS